MNLNNTTGKFILLFCLCVSLIQFTACERNRCITRGIKCLNEGVCNDGNCICTAGFEGSNCDTAQNRKFAGRFEGIFTIADSNQVYSDTITVAQVVGSNVAINWTHDIIKNAIIVGNINNEEVLIPKITTSNGHTYSGGGSLTKDIFTLRIIDDSLVGGISIKTKLYTFAGNRIK